MWGYGRGKVLMLISSDRHDDLTKLPAYGLATR